MIGSARVVIALSITLLACVAQADAPAALLAKIDAAAQATRTLSAEFTQKNRMKLFKQELTTHGKLVFRAPRQIRWEYTAPDPSVLILDGEQATLRAPGAAPQVFDLDKDATMRAIFDQLLTFVGGGSIGRAQTAYELATEGKPERPTLVLTPKAGRPVAKAFSRIALGFDDKMTVHEIRLVEPNGDEKEIVFGKVERNRPVDDRAFR